MPREGVDKLTVCLKEGKAREQGGFPAVWRNASLSLSASPAAVSSRLPTFLGAATVSRAARVNDLIRHQNIEIAIRLLLELVFGPHRLPYFFLYPKIAPF